MECREKGNKFKNATCEVHFPYKGSMMTGCQKDIPSPSSKQKECQEFLKLALQGEIYFFEPLNFNKQ